MTSSAYDITSLIRAKRRRDKFWAAVGKIAQSTLTGTGAALAGGFELMLGVGIIHAEWITALPTVGYWWAVLIVWLLRGTLSRLDAPKPSV